MQEPYAILSWEPKLRSILDEKSIGIAQWANYKHERTAANMTTRARQGVHLLLSTRSDLFADPHLNLSLDPPGRAPEFNLLGKVALLDLVVD
jgi:hypothetical protein